MQTKPVMAVFLTFIFLCLSRSQDLTMMDDNAASSSSPPGLEHSIDMSDIAREANDLSMNRASAMFQLSTVRENESPASTSAAHPSGAVKDQPRDNNSNQIRFLQ